MWEKRNKRTRRKTWGLAQCTCHPRLQLPQLTHSYNEWDYSQLPQADMGWYLNGIWKLDISTAKMLSVAYLGYFWSSMCVLGFNFLQGEKTDHQNHSIFFFPLAYWAVPWSCWVYWPAYFHSFSTSFCHFPYTFHSTDSTLFLHMPAPIFLVYVLQFLGFLGDAIDMVSGLIVKTSHGSLYGDSNHSTWKDLLSPSTLHQPFLRDVWATCTKI